LGASEAGGHGGLGELRGLAQAAHFGAEAHARRVRAGEGFDAHRVPPEIEKNGPFGLSGNTRILVSINQRLSLPVIFWGADPVMDSSVTRAI
jgi:hypothetical protein